MKKYEKEVLQDRIDAEEKEMKHLKAIYSKATEDITKKIEISNGKISVLLANWDDLTDEEKSIYQSQIYQRNFQQSLKNQIDEFMKSLESQQYKSITEYMEDCYKKGFIGAMYSIQKQGIPLIMPIDQKKIIKAMFTDSKISKKLYTKLGEDVDLLKKRIANNLSRGIATASSYSDIARNIASASNVGFNRAMRIARTEGARISNESSFDASKAAADAGCDIVKMWDAALDGRTRPHHRMLDGQIRELDEPFEVDGMNPMYPSGFGKAAEDINCRCALLQRAKWALDDEELETLKKRAEFYGLDKTKDFNDYKKKYLKAADAVPVSVPKTVKAFTPAKTIEEAEEFIKQYVDDKQFGATGVSYKGIDLDVANSINKTLSELMQVFNANKFGGIIAPAGNTKLGKLIDGAMAGYAPIRKSFIINRKTMKNMKTALKAFEGEYGAMKNILEHPERYDFSKLSRRVLDVVERAKVSGRATVPTSIEEALQHEFGHMLEKKVFNSPMWEEALANMPKYADKISGYAGENKSEYIAESFASYMKGENVVDPVLVKIFESLKR